MKYTIILFLGLFSLTTSAQTNPPQTRLGKAKSIVKNYIVADALYPKSYLPVNWSELGTLSHQTDYKLFEKTGDTTIDAKIDTFINLESRYPGYPDPVVYYTLSHAFKLKTPSGQMTLKVYSFNFGRDLNIVSVDKDTPEEQIATNRRIIAEAREKQRLIQEISQLKIAKINQQ